MKIIWKAVYRFLKIIWYFDHKIYMRLLRLVLPKLGIVIQGKPIYIAATASFDFAKPNMIEIHDNVVISGDVRVLIHDFSISRVLCYKGKLKGGEKEVSAYKKVKIGKNSFIGARTIILPGAEIGDNVIVGAGSVVRGKLEEKCVYIGNPAVKITDFDRLYDKYLDNLNSYS